MDSIGSPITRRDAVAKVTGVARYAAEIPGAGMAYAALATSTVARGRIARIDAAAAEALPGVQLVLTYRNLQQPGRPPLGRDMFVFQGGSSQTLFNPLASREVRYGGQIVAVAVADTLEMAEQAACRLFVTYDAERGDAVLGAPGQASAPFWMAKQTSPWATPARR